MLPKTKSQLVLFHNPKQLAFIDHLRSVSVLLIISYTNLF